jgi:dTDP-4-amino-4,6-dideoxygalactose transaminase
MRVPFLDLVSQYRETQSATDAALAEIFASGAYVLGKHNRELEQRVAQMHGVAHGVAVNSGTDALRIVMQACGIGPGDEVVTTAFTFVASVETIVQLGARPVFVDIDRDTFQLDPQHLSRALTARTKAVLPIHLFGQLCPMEEVCRFAEANGLIVLEDAAQAIGSVRNGKPAGSWGKAAGVSFYVTKNLGAAGDGGLVLTDDDEVAERSRSLRVHGMGRERYYYDEVGYTSRMAEIQAAVLCAKLDRLEAWTRRRGEIAEVYRAALADAPVALPTVLPGNNHTYHQFTVRVPNRDAVADHLRAQQVDSAVYYPVPIHMHAPYAPFGHGEGSLPVTEEVCRTCLSLPVQPHLTDEQVQWAASCVRESLAAAPAG